MKLITIETQLVIEVHNEIIEPSELQGLAPDKSIEGIMSRIQTRINYGLVHDIYSLAACYACYIVVGHAFNDANKRTAYQCMDLVLMLNGIELNLDRDTAGTLIIECANHTKDEDALAEWLREQPEVE